MSVKKTGVELEPHMVIRRPLVTEKGVHASEQLWDVRVDSVRTQNRKGKPRRARVALGRTKGWKKAIVKLHDEDRISFF